MQGGKRASAAASTKEAAANVGASALAGKENTKAVVEEKVTKARQNDPAEKAAADVRMQERVREAEAVKQDAMRQNAAAKERTTAAVHQPTLPSPPGRRVFEPEAAPGSHLVGDGAAPVQTTDTEAATGGHVAGAAPNATESSVALPDGAVVNDAPRPQP